jgi:hypothetical protein
MMTAQQFAEETGHGLRTVRRWISDGMPGIHRDGPAVRIDPDEALPWLESRRNVTDEVHLAQARRWLLRRHKLEGSGLVPAERVGSLARMIRRRFDKVFDQQWSDNAAWTILHDSDPAVIVATLRDFAHGSLLAFEFAIERAEYGVTTNPDILASDRRADELQLQTLTPRARSERARVDYLTSHNRIEAGELVRGDQAADRFRSAGVLVNREIRNIARRIANQAANLDDHGELAALLNSEAQRVRGDLTRELGL